MKLLLYVTKDGDNVINKDLELSKELNIRLKDNVNMYSPTIILRNVNKAILEKCNYAYIEEFERYYFIRDKTVKGSNYSLYLETDVIETFKKDILNSFCEYNKTVENGDYFSFNSDVDVRKEIDIFESDVTLQDNKIVVFSSIGGGKK